MTGRRKVFGLEANEQVRDGWHQIPDTGDTPEEEPKYDWQDAMLAVSCLTDKQKFVIELRYGLKDGTVYTQREIACLMGTTYGAVVRIESRAMRRMRRFAGGMQKLS